MRSGRSDMDRLTSRLRIEHTHKQVTVGGEAMRGESRKANRVRMEHRHPVNLMGVDGTWRRTCNLLDVSETGAKLEMEGSATVLQAKEFFLLLSSTGLAFR